MFDFRDCGEPPYVVVQTDCIESGPFGQGCGCAEFDTREEALDYLAMMEAWSK